ncbi:MAG: sigma-70 family RNA polymerase sigma factor [Defluviitaleaceae bacterium]|nr:sigma-70 family RNA polymerase sigma factor [Defluviitaleaceae bacterium]
MSLNELYEVYFPKIYNYIFYRVMNKHDAEDITGTVFLRVATHFESYDPEKGGLSGWVFRIAENALIDFYRAKRVSLNIDDMDDSLSLGVDFEGEAQLIRDETLKGLYVALSRLENKTRVIIAKKYFWGLTIREIAKKMQMNESTVSTMHNRGLKKLKELLNENRML